jgi:nucleotide-binding universal stress UspA family protein
VWLAQRSGGTLHLAHVVENPLDPIYKPDEVNHWVVVEHADKMAREMLDATARNCLPADLPRDLHVVAGDPSEKLVELAGTISADLIVMSTHDTGRIAHLLLGGIAEHVSKEAPCPVLLVRVPRE